MATVKTTDMLLVALIAIQMANTAPKQFTFWTHVLYAFVTLVQLLALYRSYRGWR